MTPRCKVEATLPRVRGALGVRGAGGVDEQEGVRPARGLAGRSVWPSACRGHLRVAQSEAAPGLSVAGRFETRRRGQLGLEAARAGGHFNFAQPMTFLTCADIQAARIPPSYDTFISLRIRDNRAQIQSWLLVH